MGLHFAATGVFCSHWLSSFIDSTSVFGSGSVVMPAMILRNRLGSRLAIAATVSSPGATAGLPSRVFRRRYNVPPMQWPVAGRRTANKLAVAPVITSHCWTSQQWHTKLFTQGLERGRDRRCAVDAGDPWDEVPAAFAASR